MTETDDTLPDDLDALKAALIAERTARREWEARAAGAEAMVAHLKRMIAKLRHDRFGASSERGRKLLDQLELELEELEAAASEDEAAAAPREQEAVRGFTRRRPVRGPLPAHLPRERVVLPSATACPCCGGRLAKLGESVTETLEVIPRQWKVVQTVREKWSCRVCETITQPPAPFHSIARGRAGPKLLAMVLTGKFADHLPLNRQSDAFAREGLELDVSTLADWVGTCAATLAPLLGLIRAHVLAGARVHGDDTTVPVLAKGKTVTGRLWTYVRDDRPFGGPAPQPRSFTTRAIGPPSIRTVTSRAGRASSRPTPMPGSTTSMRSPASPGRSPRRRVGLMGVAAFSSWPRSPRRHSPARRCGGSTRSSISSAPSTACRRSSA